MKIAILFLSEFQKTFQIWGVTLIQNNLIQKYL